MTAAKPARHLPGSHRMKRTPTHAAALELARQQELAIFGRSNKKRAIALAGSTFPPISRSPSFSSEG
jgi:hypothetical protein